MLKTRFRPTLFCSAAAAALQNRVDALRINNRSANATPKPLPSFESYFKRDIFAYAFDKRAIFTAAGKAQEAVDWMMKRGHELEEAA